MGVHAAASHSLLQEKALSQWRCCRLLIDSLHHTPEGAKMMAFFSEGRRVTSFWEQLQNFVAKAFQEVFGQQRSKDNFLV